ncbi:MAG: prolyl oligopeptidase family serine peptidase [Acidobacteriota bacterium]
MRCPRTFGAVSLAAWLAVSCAARAPRSGEHPPPSSPPASPTPAPAPPPEAKPHAYAYPAPMKGDVADDYHGTRVPDPYRGMDNAEDPATEAWVAAENALTRKLLDRPERGPIAKRLTELYDYAKLGVPLHRGRFYFYTMNSGLQNQAVCYVQERLTSTPRPLIDPNTLSPDGTLALTNTSPSHDGKLLGYALSQSGSDRQEIFVRDVATGKDRPDHLQWMKFSPITWTHDGKGFYYSHLPVPGTVPPGDEHYFPKLYYHRMGDAQDKDRLIFEKPTEKEVGVNSDISSDGRWLILYATKGASNKTEIQVVDLRKPGAKPAMVFKGYEYGYNVADVVDGRLYAWTDRDAPMGRMIAVDVGKLAPGSPADAPTIEVVPESKDKLVLGGIVDRKLVLDYLHNAATVLTVARLDGTRLDNIPLPGIGSVATITGEAPDKDMFFGFSSFTEPTTTYRYVLATKALTIVRKPRVPVDAARYETEQVWYPSKDGTKVSMFLVHKKGLAKDGNRPTLLYGYGGFAVAMTPAYSPLTYVLLEKDGIFAVANLRGGDEYGEDWHKAAIREKKQTVFDDFIAAAEWLVKSGWTSTPRLAIRGGSNGGLLVAAVEEQRPDLFGAVVCQVPVADMLRFHKFTLGRYWIAEYGNADLAEDFPFLYKYSPLQNVRDGVAYPPTLITTADTDDRVDPSHSKKFAARLQEADAGKNPILIRIETKAGHGAGKPTSKILEEAADIWTFVFWRLGLS